MNRPGYLVIGIFIGFSLGTFLASQIPYQPNPIFATAGAICALIALLVFAVGFLCGV